MSKQDHIIAILYDLSQTISSEVKLSPLLKKLLQRLMYHTGYSSGLIVSSEEDGSYCLQTAIGDIGSKKDIGKSINIYGNNNKDIDITSLPVKQGYYKSTLTLSIPNYGKIILLTVEKENKKNPYKEIFAPVLSNLSKTIALCKFSEAYTTNLIKEKEKLTDSNLLFRQSLDTSSDFVILVDLESSTIVDFNKSTAQSLGYSSEEIYKLNLDNLFTEDTYTNFTKSIKELISTKQSIVSEFNFLNKKGEPFPIEARLSLLTTEDNPPVLIIVASDITERKKAETDIFNANKLSETTLNSIGDAVITTDNRGHINRMNPIAEELTGWKFREADGKLLKDIFKIVNASTGKKIPNPVEIVMKTGKTVFLSNHTTLKSRNGREYQIADSAAPIRSKGSHILGTVLVFNDVTEQYKLREDLLKRELEQRDILNSMIDGVITFDETGKINTFNRSAEQIFGYSADNIIGKHLTVLVENSPDSPSLAYIGDMIKTTIGTTKDKINEISNELTGQKNDSSNFPMRLSVAELPKNEDGKRYFIASCQELTYIKGKEEQLRRSLKMDALGKLTGGIAHDYNNMLGVVLGFTELLNMELSEDPKLSTYLTNIRHASERGAALTKKLLSFSKKETPTSKSFKINELIEDEKNILEKTLTARIKLELNLEKNIWPTWIDSSDLEDALLNICINAMHAMKDNGKLTIVTSNKTINKNRAAKINLNEGDYVLLSITDSGSGMDEETLEKIFDPFYTTKGELGTGLGLSQVYGFVERSKGAIKVKSELGVGTTFNIYFPRYYETEKKKVKGVSTSETSKLQGDENILVVDDEPALQSLAAVALGQNGYHTVCAGSGKEALLALKKLPIDLVVSDVIMPEMNGFQLAKIIKDKYPKIKIQLVSGFDSRNEIEKLDERLHKNLLYKPFKIVELLTKIRELLDS